MPSAGQDGRHISATAAGGGRKASGLAREEILAGIRPEHLNPVDTAGGPALAGRVKTQVPLGRETLVHVEVDDRDLIFLSPVSQKAQ